MGFGLLFIGSFFALIGFSAEVPGLGVIGMMTGIISLLIGAAVKANKNE